MTLPKENKDRIIRATLQTDLWNYTVAEKAYFLDKATYGKNTDLEAAPYSFTYSFRNLVTVSDADRTGYSVTITNPTISSGTKVCSVSMGGKDADGIDGMDGIIKCW